MPIAFDASSKSDVANGNIPQTLTFSHTCTGSDLILFISVCIVDSATITGVTYNGVAMTSIGSVDNTTTSFLVYLFYLISPATGAHNIIVSASSTAAIAAQAASYTGAKQTGVPDASNITGVTTTTDFLQSVTIIANNCWIVWAAGTNNTKTAGINTTIRQVDTVRYGNLIADTNASQGAAGSKTMELTSVSSTYVGILASFAPSTSSVNSNFLAFM